MGKRGERASSVREGRKKGRGGKTEGKEKKKGERKRKREKKGKKGRRDRCCPSPPRYEAEPGRSRRQLRGGGAAVGAGEPGRAGPGRREQGRKEAWEGKAVPAVREAVREAAGL